MDFGVEDDEPAMWLALNIQGGQNDHAYEWSQQPPLG
jgi:hypothetical protein